MMMLKDFKFFYNFPEVLVEQLQQVSSIVSFPAQSKIIEQGVKNDSLYFLVKGHLKVYVDDGLVAELDQLGDLLGEMSLISAAPPTATIVAGVECQMLRLAAADLERITAENQYNLHKIYSSILVDKLEATNHRAKQLEGITAKLELAQDQLRATNASLELKVKDRTAKLESFNEDLKSKNNELQATHDKLADLYQSRDITFQSLDRLLSDNLVPLKESLSDLKSERGVDEAVLDSVESEVVRAIHQLEPLATSFRNEKSMGSQRVLLAEPIRKQQSVAKLALGGTGVSLDIVQTEEEAEQKLRENKYDIFMFNKDFLKLTEMAREKSPDIQFVYITSEEIAEYVPTLLGHTFVPNVVSRDEGDKQFTIKNYVTTVSKLASGNYFGLEKYISWGVEVKQFDVSRSDQRAELIQGMDDYFANSGLRSSNRGRCSVVAEELLMNAIYDAPRDKKGNPLYNHQDRTQAIELKKSHQALFRFATDGNLMAVSIEDPFGGLHEETLFSYLKKCYEGGSLNDGRTDKGGGGRGLHQIIENSDLVVFNIDPGKRTEVIALFNADQKSAVERSPNLHFFKKAS